MVEEEKKPMKLIEAMKRLKLLEKRMSGNVENITKYASQLSHEKLYFNTPDEQTKEVSGLIQSTHDLVWEYMRLKTNIDHTNLRTVVMIKGDQYTLAQLLLMKRKMVAVLRDSYQALNNRAAESRMHRSTIVPEGVPVSIITFFDERDKNVQLLHWMELESEIDARLEVINATTDLLELSEN